MASQAPVLTQQELFDHWLGHRRLTRKVIQAFPEDKLFEYSIGGMRPFSALAMEMIRLAGTGVNGIVTGEWKKLDELFHDSNPAPKTKEELLNLWDAVTALLNSTWPKISADRFKEKIAFFGQYEGPVYSSVLYLIDNEIHHRGQGYVYLRSLGIEPPPFYYRD